VFALDISVTKADGSKQLFNREKVVQTCLKMGATIQMANEVAGQVQRSLFEGVPTRTILQLIFRLMEEYKPEVGHLFDLRTGISLMDSKPEFEMFVQVLLAHSDFDVSPNRILRGKCGRHEVDAIAKRDGVIYFVEIKHHLSYHSLTGLDESRIAQAILEDAQEAVALGLTDFKVDRAMIVTNTRYSEHAVEYGTCKNILLIGWSSPQTLGLREIIEKSNLYPLSCLRGLSHDDRTRFVNSGILLLKQLLEQDRSSIAAKTGLPYEVVVEVTKKARAGANALWGQ
jgi:Holliday junction resolvase-like predicted endonuclease